jgi:hypothetical protein
VVQYLLVHMGDVQLVVLDTQGLDLLGDVVLQLDFSLHLMRPDQRGGAEAEFHPAWAASSAPLNGRVFCCCGRDVAPPYGASVTSAASLLPKVAPSVAK